MRITRRQLRRLILQEVRIKPDAINIPPQHLDKIHNLIDTGELAQAQSLIDAFGGDPNYARNYTEYEKVGDMEKRGNEVAAMFDDPLPFNTDGPLPARPLKPGFSYDDMYAKDQEAYALARKKRDDYRDSYPPGVDVEKAFIDAENVFDTHIDRYFKNRNRPIRDDDFLK
jgi:hypothetical protein